MRGWEVLRFSENENNEPNGETIRLMTNIEIRQKIYKSFGMTVFSDGGLLAEVFPKKFYSEVILSIEVTVNFTSSPRISSVKSSPTFFPATDLPKGEWYVTINGYKSNSSSIGPKI